jgi:hypothetical protein
MGPTVQRRTKRGLAAGFLAATMVMGAVGEAGAAPVRPDAAYLRALMGTVTPGSPAHFRLVEDMGATSVDGGAAPDTPVAPAACGFRIGGC